MPDIDYNELFGIGENEQEIAEPAEETANEETAEEPVADTEAEPEDLIDEQSPEDNAKYAAARRKAEQERDLAIARARQEAKAEADRTISEAYKALNLKNPYTDTPITNKAEFDAYRTRFENEKKEKVISKSGMSSEEFTEFVNDLPEVKAIREDAERAKADYERAAAEQAKVKVAEQLTEINALDPTIKTIEDLTKMDNYDAFYGLVKRGLTFTEAFKLANYDTIQEKRATAQKQAAINAAKSKDHLTGTSSRGQGAVSVPADIKEQYRIFMPNATDAEISAHYNKSLKR